MNNDTKLFAALLLKIDENNNDLTSYKWTVLEKTFHYCQSHLADSDHEDDLFSFTTPDIFINPKGDQYQTDVVSEPEYTYTLKDVNNFPDSVLIEVYAFNDCGKSNSLSTYIRFN